MRRRLFAALAAVFMVISVGSAQAGGSWLDPSWVRVEAGDHVEMSGFVSHGQLGWTQDGPFFTYLLGDTFGQVVSEGHGGAKTDVPLGALRVEPKSNGVQVSTDFVLPVDMPPGEYQVLVCNDPCSTGLGDLIGGVLYVGVDPPSQGEEIATTDIDEISASKTGVAVAGDANPPSFATKYISLSPYPSRSSGLSPVWVAISAGLAGAVLLAAVAVRQNTGPR